MRSCTKPISHCCDCRLAGEQGSGFKREWRDYCIGNHSDWTYMFWDREAAEIFLETHYPWFISTFKSYPKTVQQGASLHPFSPLITRNVRNTGRALD